jgi:hypothetical protein
MYNDPIVEQTRKLRDEYARQFNYDLDAICRDLMERQERSDRRLVRRQPKRPANQPRIAHHATEQTHAPEP